MLQRSLPSTWRSTLIGFSHQKVGETIGRFLYRKGYHRFGLVWGNDERSLVRRKGLEPALKEHGITDIPTYQAPIPATLESGRIGLCDLLEAGHALDVIACSSDILAQRVLIKATVQKILVPNALGIMGFGNMNFSARMSPSISSIHIDKYAIGVQAAEALLARIEGCPQAEKILGVGFELIERETTRR